MKVLVGLEKVGVVFPALVGSQLVRVGRSLAIAPVVVGTIVAIAGGMVAGSWSAVQASTMLGWLTQVFTIVVGVTGAVALTGDRLVELHESTPVSFRKVQFLRSGVVAVCSVIGGLVMFVPLHVLHAWPHDVGWISAIVPVGGALFMVAVAMAAAAFSGTVSAATISVIAGWVFLSLLWDPYILNLWAQRGLPLAAAVVLVALAWRRLGDAEKNVAKAVVA